MNRPESNLSAPVKRPDMDEDVIDRYEQDGKYSEEEAVEEVVEEAVEEAVEAKDAVVDDTYSIDVTDSSIQIASVSAMSDMDTEDALGFVQLGDYVIIESQKYNGQTRGVVYYRSLDKIRIKPDGVSDILHDFDLIQTEEEELYKDEDGVTAIYIIKKRTFESFIEQQDFRVKQTIDALYENGTIVSYRVMEVDKENDTIKLQEKDDPESEKTISFNYIGIPPEEGIRVLSIREFVGSDEKNAPNDAPSKGEMKYDVDEEEEEEEVELNEEQNKLNRIEMLGTVEIVKPLIYREAESYEQRIPDHLQKVDAMNDFINSLDPTLQKDPHALRQIRILVETLYLLNKETIEYDQEGEVIGAKRASVQTISELVTNASVSMGRPVLKISKKLYTVNDDEEEEDEHVFTKPFYPELLQMIENKSPVVSSVIMGQGDSKTIVREWLQQQIFSKEYAPWVADKSSAFQWRPLSDSEFFRSEPPKTEEISEDHYALESTVRGYLPSHDENESPILDDISFGLERALGPTYRKGVDRRKQLHLQPEEAPLLSYLLFPQQTIPYIGKKRTYSLAYDSGRSQMPMKSMKTMLEELGEPIDKYSTSKNILLLNTVGGELGTIPLHSYIAGLYLPALGVGDVFQTLVHYGLDDYELYPSLYRVLKEKIALSQNQVKSALSTLRNQLMDIQGQGQGQEQEKKEQESNELIPSASMWEAIASQDILSRAVEEYQKRNPRLASSDIGKVLYLIQRYDNFFQVTSAKNPVYIAKAVMEVYNKEYIDVLRVQSELRKQEREAGKRPKKNFCQHVADMVSVRRLNDDAERFYEMTKVFKRYQGERKDNWFHCNVCKDHLICIHERLQLQAYLHPKERDLLEKEIILKCSGGQFQGKYICRNCGQSIRDLDFDNNMEYDDDGKPMSGNAALEDADTLLEERVEDLLKTDANITETVQWNMNMEEKKCYDIARILSERVGVFMDQQGFMKVIQRTLQYMNKLLPRATYTKMMGSTSKYEVYHSSHFVIFCSLFILLEIQSKIPEYVVRYRLLGCKTTGFDGYPLDTDVSKRDGLEYMACAISSIRLKDSPWKDTRFVSEPNDTKRINLINNYMKTLLDKVMEDANIQASLAEKRRYLIEVMGRTGLNGDQVPRDMVFPTFLPQLTMPSITEAAENAITPEIAEKMGAKGKHALIQLWIRRAHQYATESLSVVHGSPYLETTCCITPLSAPHEAWSRVEDMPTLVKRIWSPQLESSMLMTHFIPRLEDTTVAEADTQLFYRVFLKYCFQGSRVGHTHEVNLTHRCIWCGFQFPSHPKLMDNEKEGRPALEGQGVSSDTQAFTGLLDQIHTVHEVIPIPLPHRMGFAEVMAEFGAMDPPPVDNWSEVMGTTIDALQRINMNTNTDDKKGDILVALGTLSDIARQYEEQLNTRLPSKYRAVADEIVKLPWTNFFQVLQTYFITLYYRVLSGFSKASLFIPVELRSTLSDQHVNDLQGMMTTHLSSFHRITTPVLDEPQMDLAKAKLQFYTEQMAEISRFRDKIRTLTLPGRRLTLEYIQRVMFYGPLAIMANSYHIPKDAVIQSAVKEIGNHSMDYLLLLIRTSLEHYTKERVSYDDARIKDMITVQAEKERVHVLKEFDKLTDEERAIEKLNKKLGLGKWAVGGTKLIYAYDKDYYDQERTRRLDAGMIDFPGVSTGEMLPSAGREQDAMGFPVFSDQDYEKEGGYDHAQYGDDE